MLGFPLGLLYANALEWALHRWVLHGLGRDPKSFYAFHWHEHHRTARKNAMRDPGCTGPVELGDNAQTREIGSLLALAALHAPLLAVAPWFYAGAACGGVSYLLLHRKAHRDPEWCRSHMPWHYDHHMGPDQDANWCVTRPWFDELLGTRVPFVSTEREREREERRSRRVAPVAPAAA